MFLSDYTVLTAFKGVRNPGLMQSHNGSGSCAGVNPCPWSSILQMIRDGTAGTSSGDGLKQTMAKTAGATGAGSARSKSYKSLFIFGEI